MSNATRDSVSEPLQQYLFGDVESDAASLGLRLPRAQKCGSTHAIAACGNTLVHRR